MISQSTRCMEERSEPEMLREEPQREQHDDLYDAYRDVCQVHRAEYILTPDHGVSTR